VRPVEQVRDELLEAALTAARQEDERAAAHLQAAEAAARAYAALPPDEQEAVRIDLAAIENASPDDVGLRVRDRALERIEEERGRGTVKQEGDG
jgi:hypothetical protein